MLTINKMFSFFSNLFTRSQEGFTTTFDIAHGNQQKYMQIHPDGTVEYPVSQDSDSVQFSNGFYPKVYLAGEYLTKKNKFHRFPQQEGEPNPFASSLESFCHTRFDERYNIVNGPVVIEWVDSPSESDIAELADNYYAWATYMNSQNC